MGTQAQIRLRSPAALLTRPTKGQNFCSRSHSAGHAARSRPAVPEEYRCVGCSHGHAACFCSQGAAQARRGGADDAAAAVELWIYPRFDRGALMRSCVAADSRLAPRATELIAQET